MTDFPDSQGPDEAPIPSATLGDSPEAIALCDALDDVIGTCIDDAGLEDDTIERAYLALVASVQEGGA